MKSCKELKNGISVVICTYNGERTISQAIQSVLTQSTNIIKSQWELVIVDNNSNDSTASLLKKLQTAENIIIVDEPRPGLMNARLKGIGECSYEYMLFCDDDNYLLPDYLDKAYSLLNSNNKIGVLGGQGLKFPSSIMPNWFDDVSKGYAIGPQGNKIKGQQFQHHVYGAGSLYNKSAIDFLLNQKIIFNLIGRKGREFSSGEDYEMCYLIKHLGHEVWYYNDLCFYHDIDPNRISRRKYLDLMKGMGKSQLILNNYRYSLNISLSFLKKLDWRKELIFVTLKFIKRTLILLFDKKLKNIGLWYYEKSRLNLMLRGSKYFNTEKSKVISNVEKIYCFRHANK